MARYIGNVQNVLLICIYLNIILSRAVYGIGTCQFNRIATGQNLECRVTTVFTADEVALDNSKANKAVHAICCDAPFIPTPANENQNCLPCILPAVNAAAAKPAKKPRPMMDELFIDFPGGQAGAAATGVAALAALAPPPLPMFPPSLLPQPTAIQPGVSNVVSAAGSPVGGGALPSAAITVM